MMRNYLKEFGAKSTTPRMFAFGGGAPDPNAPQGAPAGPGGAPMGGPPSPDAATPPPAPGGPEQVDAMLQQYAQTRDPQLAVQICDAMVQMQGGAPQPAGGPQGGPGMPSGPEAAAIPMARNGGTIPVFKKGGSLPAGKKALPSFKKTAKASVKGAAQNK